MSTHMQVVQGEKKQVKSSNLEKLIPLDKLEKNIEQVLAKSVAAPSREQKFAILVASGSFCPVHKMHQKMFEIAKQHIESKLKHHVVAGFFSPCHDGYVSYKLDEDFIPAKERVAMCELALQDHPWLGVSTVESLHLDSPSYCMKVAERHHSMLLDFMESKTGKKNAFTVFLVCGADLVIRTVFQSKIWNCVNVIVIGREFADDDLRNRFELTMMKYEFGMYPIHFVLEHEGLQNMSSTLVRNALKHCAGNYNLFENTVKDFIEIPVAKYLFTKMYNEKKLNH